MTNVTGWNELMNGSIVESAYVALNVPLGGYLLIILYCFLSLLLYNRTQSLELVFSLGIIFFAVFGAIGVWVTSLQYGIMITILVFELGGVLWKIFTK